MTGTTDDRNDPDLHNIDPATKMQNKYLVLSEEERKKGFVRPVRQSYLHLTCQTITTMGRAIAETYARDPQFYGGTYCVTCKDHFRVGPDGEFNWTSAGTDTGIKVGT